MSSATPSDRPSRQGSGPRPPKEEPDFVNERDLPTADEPRRDRPAKDRAPDELSPREAHALLVELVAKARR